MKINIAKSAGFCFGVKRALKIAQQTAEISNQVYMLGDIVHNENVVADMKNLGIKTIKNLSAGEGKILLIRAHGAQKKTVKQAKEKGYKVVDATCPMVKEIHNIAKNHEKQKYSIIIIGDKKHDEVRGILGQLKNKALVIDKVENIPFDKIRQLKKAAVVVQSTQNLDKTLQIAEKLKEYIPDFKFSNTICNATRLRQKEIKRLPKENDVVIIIGSKKSANTRRLYELSKSINNRTYWINSANQIKPQMLVDAKSVGITAGASTPDYVIEAVTRKIHEVAGLIG